LAPSSTVHAYECVLGVWYRTQRMATVVLLGTLDTKGAEYDFVRQRLLGLGCDVVIVDAGTMGQTRYPVDVGPDEVAAAAGLDRAQLAADGDRGAAMAAMSTGSARIVGQLHADGRLDAILALGGSGGATLGSAAMRALPIGVPKLLVSTMAAGDTRPYVGESDIAMLHSVVDVAGINRISARILGNAAAAIAGMARAAAGPSADAPDQQHARPLVAATMFGVTTPCVTVARERLEALGYEVLVFHATGTGGRAMEALVRAGALEGVLDVSTTELADEIGGGVLSAGPDRLEAAGAAGIPQVVSLGALDMINFGPIDTVPAEFRSRNLHRHNASVTLMRTTLDENAQLGRLIARKVNGAKGPVSVFMPLGGVSMIDAPGEPFHDPVADAALFDALREGLRPDVERVEMPVHINDPAFGHAMAERLHALITTNGDPRGQPVPIGATSR
jgi:uncharacterized protein (UPF0261 family)